MTRVEFIVYWCSLVKRKRPDAQLIVENDRLTIHIAGVHFPAGVIEPCSGTCHDERCCGWCVAYIPAGDPNNN